MLSMTRKHTKYSDEFKKMVVRERQALGSDKEVSRKYDLPVGNIYRWSKDPKYAEPAIRAAACFGAPDPQQALDRIAEQVHALRTFVLAVEAALGHSSAGKLSAS